MEKWKLQKIKEALYPKSVAVLGVSNAANNLGTQVVEVLMAEGFPGAIHPVHPRMKSLLGLKVYSSLDEIGHPVDLVISGLNAKLTAEDVIESCARIGVKGIVCLAGGFKEVGNEGLHYEKKLKEVADKNQIIIFGPNILGVINNLLVFQEGKPTGSRICRKPERRYCVHHVE
jgi:acetyl-CoA synthetase (ADP-forming)